MYTYKTLLVHYDAGRTAPSRLETAIGIATAFDAHIDCLYALKTVHEPSHAYEAGQVLREAQQRLRAGMLAEARLGYDACLRRTGFERAEWRVSEADALEVVTLHARCSDLVVIGQKNPEWPSGVDKDFERNVLLATARPVLVVPYAFEHRPIGQRVLIAWNASREAARAVADALPLLARASHVHVVSFQSGRARSVHDEEPGPDIAQYLARHGVKATVSCYDDPEIDVGNQLLSRAFDLSADLIVMGAWGHSRVRELVLGGVTRSMLEVMTVPVLMAN